ncbi:Oidioi.mRNA.OKI2018_I69.PAR.g9547.t1.cds [Oikopleura dioica]|uniref:Oidioi.mRNA.OKI2018_I69.PAR.g9547.t1.cds n=1 Tax=Oikopleura dioica TaxID=34765 RepID=A0ABN7RQD6_OIKDI|nr:Oidioi.mRNA.OKI2018_I69.PAR.g9547.t1.cds [Oikopleura dioica]
MSSFDEDIFLAIEQREWTVECTSSTSGFVLVDCFFKSIEKDPIEETFFFSSNNMVMCGENADAGEPVIDYCNNLAYRLATHVDIPIRQGENARDIIDIAKDISSFLMSETIENNECITDCSYKSRLLKRRAESFSWEKHKYFIGLGVIVLFAMLLIGLLVKKLLRKRSREITRDNVNSSQDDSLLRTA